MTICKFWQQGHCRNGSSCRFEHPRGQPDNRFSSLNNNMTNQTSNTQANNYSISADQLRKDLTQELPLWILSCYAPGKDAPEQLFGGYPREQSFEEIRLHYLSGVQSGNEQGARNEIEQLYRNANDQIQNALSDTSGAVNFILSAEHKHPNRHDVIKQSGPSSGTGVFSVGRSGTTNSPGPFGSNTANTPANTFNRPSAFGAATFGQPSQPQSAFGRPSQPAFGQPPQPQSAFGQPSQPSAFGQPSQPTFGQSSQPQSAFGQSSQPAFGQPSQTASAFGSSQTTVPSFSQPPQPQSSAFGSSTQSAFGQPSALGSRPSPFGQPTFGQSAQPQNSTFGQPSALGGGSAQGGAFGGAFSQSTNQPSPFGQSTSNNNASSVFEQKTNTNTQSPFGQNTNNTSSAFGQPSNTSSPFAKPAPTTFAAALNNTTNQGPFGQQPQNGSTAANPFGSSQQQAKPFGQTNNQNQFGASTAQGSAFGAPSNPSSGAFRQPSVSNAFGQPSAPQQNTTNGPVQTKSPYQPNSAYNHPPLLSYSAKGPNGLVQWKGKPVTYKNDTPGVQDSFGGGGWVKIWFPDGAPEYSKDTELSDGEYKPEQLAQWQEFVQTKRFSSLLPELAPKREFCTWDF